MQCWAGYCEVNSLPRESRASLQSEKDKMKKRKEERNKGQQKSILLDWKWQNSSVKTNRKIDLAFGGVRGDEGGAFTYFYFKES